MTEEQHKELRETCMLIVDNKIKDIQISVDKTLDIMKDKIDARFNDLVSSVENTKLILEKTKGTFALFALAAVFAGGTNIAQIILKMMGKL